MNNFVHSRQLRYLIKRANYTIEELASAINMNLDTVMKLISKHNLIDSPIVVRIKEVLGCSNADLLSNTYVNEKEIIGCNLRKLRKDKGLNQKTMSTLLGLPAYAYNRYEKGTRTQDIAVLRKVVETLDIQFSELFDIQTQAEVDTPVNSNSYIENRLKILKAELSKAKNLNKQLELKFRIDELQRMQDELAYSLCKCL